MIRNDNELTSITDGLEENVRSLYTLLVNRLLSPATKNAHVEITYKGKKYDFSPPFDKREFKKQKRLAQYLARKVTSKAIRNLLKTIYTGFNYEMEPSWDRMCYRIFDATRPAIPDQIVSPCVAFPFVRRCKADPLIPDLKAIHPHEEIETGES